MARHAHPRKLEVLEAIQRHLATVGSNNWNVIIDKFQDVVHEQTLWRWIREAKSADVPRPELITSRAKLVQKIKGATNDRETEAYATGTAPVAKHLPAAPSPAYIARTGEAGLQNIDFVMEIQVLYKDAQLLRAYAMKQRKDPETGEVSEAINNPVMFDKSIARRAGLLETAIRAVQEIWDLRQMQNFYETVLEEIGHADPETQKRIIDRLAALNSRTGMTMAFKV